MRWRELETPEGILSKLYVVLGYDHEDKFKLYPLGIILHAGLWVSDNLLNFFGNYSEYIWHEEAIRYRIISLKVVSFQCHPQQLIPYLIPRLSLPLSLFFSSS